MNARENSFCELACKLKIMLLTISELKGVKMADLTSLIQDLRFDIF